jgi:alpha-D-xyloside xylohydrolase
VTRSYRIDEFPLFVRAGAILPMGPIVEYVDQKPDGPYEVRIYPGADAHFTLYEDDGETYRYEVGEYATVALAWNDAHRTLRIGARHGRFPGLTRERTLHVKLMASQPGQPGVARTVRFSGEPIELRFAR